MEHFDATLAFILNAAIVVCQDDAGDAERIHFLCTRLLEACSEALEQTVSARYYGYREKWRVRFVQQMIKGVSELNEFVHAARACRRQRQPVSTVTELADDIARLGIEEVSKRIKDQAEPLPPVDVWTFDSVAVFDTDYTATAGRDKSTWRVQNAIDDVLAALHTIPGTTGARLPPPVKRKVERLQRELIFCGLPANSMPANPAPSSQSGGQPAQSPAPQRPPEAKRRQPARNRRSRSSRSAW